MTFCKNAAEIARNAMKLSNPNLVDQYEKVILFLSGNPSYASKMRGANAPEIGSVDYVRRQAAAFSDARNAKSPNPPKTIPDEMVSIILEEYFEIPHADLERVKCEHLLSMGAENLVGDLLERFLASILEPHGWIWCSGAMVKAVDFIKPPTRESKGWRLLQVKNRDNSENSSSMAVRNDTPIEKWFRTFSKKVGSNWGAFPDASRRADLSEQAFKAFVRHYLKTLRSITGDLNGQ